MKAMECDVIRDLLPLYADEACSEKSRALVNEHLLDCADCRAMLEKIKETEIENNLKSEKESVLQYGITQFKKRTAAVGSAVSGAFLVPILICRLTDFCGPTLTCATSERKPKRSDSLWLKKAGCCSVWMKTRSRFPTPKRNTPAVCFCR